MAATLTDNDLATIRDYLLGIWRVVAEANHAGDEPPAPLPMATGPALPTEPPIFSALTTAGAWGCHPVQDEEEMLTDGVREQAAV